MNFYRANFVDLQLIEIFVFLRRRWCGSRKVVHWMLTCIMAFYACF